MIEIDWKSWMYEDNTNTSALSRTARAQLVGVYEALSQQDMPQLVLAGLVPQNRDSDSMAENEPYSITYAQTELSLQLRADGSLVTVWKGSHTGDSKNIALGVATVVRQPNGDVFANFGTETSAYMLHKLQNMSSSSALVDGYHVQESFWKDELEHEEDITGVPAGGAGAGAGTGTVSNWVQEEEPTVFLAGSTNVPATVETKTFVSGKFPISFAAKPTNRLRRRKQRLLQDTNTTDDGNDFITIDVLVLVTYRALCESAGITDLTACQLNDYTSANMEGKLAVAVAETNAGLMAADAATRIRISRIDYLGSGSFDGTPSTDTLEFLRTNPTVQQARSETRSDLVSIVTASGGSGLAYLNGFVLAVSHNYFPFYTFQHELMHCLGANHDRDHSGFFQHQYGHGYQAPGMFRTVMSYSCADGINCPRIPFLSANGYEHDGVPIGDATHDNARLVRENAFKVSQYFIGDADLDNNQGIVTESVDIFKLFFGFFALCLSG